ncbi:MAG: hypothetical protein ACI4T6_10555, partial [Candidatus Flemingiibacterium sp.]
MLFMIFCSIACICYFYSFYGFMMFCRFMEWNVTFGLDAAEMYGTEPAKVTISSVLNTDWGAWLADYFGTIESTMDVVLVILMAIMWLIAAAIALGLIFLAFYVPYRTMLSAIPEKTQAGHPKAARLLALILSLISHPIMWYLGLHYGNTLFGIFAAIVLLWSNTLICYYVLMFCLSKFLAPLAGAASAVAGAVSNPDSESSSEFDLSHIPFIVYDGSGRKWKRRGIFGDHAVY